ncbi:MAG: alkaline phosphatase family protein [Candidatus Sulfotelmatobacter sp.]
MPSAVAAQATSQCKATVQGTGAYSSAVTWSASKGSINASGLFTAPASPGTVTVTATSSQDTTKSGTASVTVQSTPPTITAVAVTCTPSTIAVSATSQCTATVQGTGAYSSAVLWSASKGSINASGLFTAPASPGTVTVTATNSQDTTKSGTATVTVQSTPPTITAVAVTCTPSTIAVNATSQCNAIVQGTGTYSSTVTWSASEGTINAIGLFTAAVTAGTVRVTATSTQDTTKSGTATVTVQLQTPQSKHIVLVMEENQSYAKVVGNTGDWPNLNNLISSGALPTNYYANSHPSIGNYFMLTTGQLLTTDDNSTQVWNVDNLARRMLASGVSFRIYAEGITQGYVGGNTGLYLIRHNPFAMLSDVADNPQVANECIWPFTQFAADLASGTLPEFSFIVPDVDDDAHNGTPQQADVWLQANVVVPLSNSSAFASGGDGILLVDFDEAADTDTAYGGGHVAPVLWGPNVKVGYTQTSSTVYQHQSMLRTVMEALQLTNPPDAAASAASMAEFFVQK